MKKVMFVLALLTVLLLPGMGQAQEPSDNGTIPPYTLWLPMVGEPVICEDPGITDWGYRYDRICRLYPPPWDVVCVTVKGFRVYSYHGIDVYIKIRGEETAHEMYGDSPYVGCSDGIFCIDYPIESGTTYEVSFKAMCRDQTWSNWTDWKEIVVPDEE